MRDFVETTRQKNDFSLFFRLLKFAAKYWKQFVFVVVLMGLSMAVNLITPFLVGKMLDTIFDVHVAVSDKMRFMTGITVFFLATMLATIAIIYFQTFILQAIGQSIVMNFRTKVYKHIISLSIGQINSLPVGKLVTRVCNDTNGLSEMFTGTFVNLVRNFLQMIAIYIIFFFLNISLALVVTASIPLIAIATILFRKYSRAANRVVKNNISELNAFLSENLSGMKITQIFNQEDKKRSEFMEKSYKLKKSFLRERDVFAIFRPFIFLVYLLTLSGILYFGYKQVLAGAMTFGEVFTFGALYTCVQYVQNFFDPVQGLADQFNVLQNAFASAEKIFDVLDTKPEIEDTEGAIDIESFSGHIEFIDVCFSYVPGVPVLKNISFEIKPDEVIAFVGSTGSGKTTILSLIVRNYDIDSGQILIDGIDIKKITRHSLRKHIGQMLQDVFLFNDTIRNNITLHNKELSDDEIWESVKYVNAENLINKLDGKLEYMVLERGNNFSSGERQLLSFARTICYKPSLIILDEATANIDSETEVLIQDSLSKMMSIKTMIIVAHRLSTIQHSNKIFVMQKGEIKESGTHQELLSKGGIYYSLYQLQYENKEEA